MDSSGLNDAPRQIVGTLRQFTTLVQDEMALARAELSSNLSRAGLGIAFVLVAALLALVALNVLATALVELLTANGVAPWLAALSIGGVLLVTAVALALVGKSRLTPEALAPTRTFENIKKDFGHLKEESND